MSCIFLNHVVLDECLTKQLSHFLLLLSGDYVELRDWTIKSGAVKNVVQLALEDNLTIPIRQRFMRLLAIFFRQDPDGVPPELAKEILKFLKISLNNHHDRVSRFVSRRNLNCNV